MDSISRWTMAQQSVLGSCLIDEGAVQTVLAQTTAEMFDDIHRPLWQAISGLFLAGRTVDPVTVAGQLEGTAVTRPFLMELMAVTPTSANVSAYLRELREVCRLRQVQEIGQQLSSVQQTEQAADLLGQLTALMSGRRASNVHTFLDLMGGFPEAHQQLPNYLRWGLPVLDQVLTIRPGSYVILGGYPSAGKTALALQFLLSQASPPSGKRIGLFSYETDEAKIRDRSVAHAAGYDLSDVLSKTTDQLDPERLLPRLRELSELPITVITANGMNVAQIYSLSAAHRFDVVYIDYIQLIRRNPRLPGHEAVAEISRQLQTMAHSTGITVVGLSQLSRPPRAVQPAKQSKKMMLGTEEVLLPPRLVPVQEPTMSDLRESGQLEQDADAIMILWRPYPESPDMTDRYLRIAKNKDGPSGGKVILRFDGAKQRFSPDTQDSLFTRIRQAARLSPPRQEAPEPLPMEQLSTED